jgi:hypothetical protein
MNFRKYRIHLRAFLGEDFVMIDPQEIIGAIQIELNLKRFFESIAFGWERNSALGFAVDLNPYATPVRQALNRIRKKIMNMLHNRA